MDKVYDFVTDSSLHALHAAWTNVSPTHEAAISLYVDSVPERLREKMKEPQFTGVRVAVQVICSFRTLFVNHEEEFPYSLRHCLYQKFLRSHVKDCAGLRDARAVVSFLNEIAGEYVVDTGCVEPRSLPPVTEALFDAVVEWLFDEGVFEGWDEALFHLSLATVYRARFRVRVRGADSAADEKPETEDAAAGDEAEEESGDEDAFAEGEGDGKGLGGGRDEDSGGDTEGDTEGDVEASSSVVAQRRRLPLGMSGWIIHGVDGNPALRIEALWRGTLREQSEKSSGDVLSEDAMRRCVYVNVPAPCIEVVKRALREISFDSFEWVPRPAFCMFLRARFFGRDELYTLLCDFVKDRLPDAVAAVSALPGGARRMNVVFLGDIVARCETPEQHRLAWELLYQCAQHHREPAGGDSATVAGRERAKSPELAHGCGLLGSGGGAPEEKSGDGGGAVTARSKRSQSTVAENPGSGTDQSGQCSEGAPGGRGFGAGQGAGGEPARKKRKRGA